MDDFLSKPLRPAELAEVLARVPRRVVDTGDEVTTAADPRAALRERVREMAGGDDSDLERELTEDFLTGLPTLLSDLERAASAGDQVTLRRTAHTLKSHATLFGLTTMGDRARQLEEGASAEEDVDDELVAQLVEEAGRAAAALSSADVMD